MTEGDRTSAAPAARARAAAPARQAARARAAQARVAEARAAEASALAALGLAVGEQIRFRRPDRARWQPGVVQRLQRDGSIGVTDANGAARAVALAHVQVQARARPRRAAGTAPARWEPLADRAARTEQLTLL